MVGRILRANVGSVVTIEFADGEVIEAKISSVDSDEHNDVTYEVVSVRSPGFGVRYKPGNFYQAKIADIARVIAAG